MIDVLEKPEVSRLLQFHNGLCVCCDNRLNVQWTDMNAEARCLTCGMTYFLANHLPSIQWLITYSDGTALEDVQFPYCRKLDSLLMYRAIWQETASTLPIGMYLGRSPYRDSEWDTYIQWLHNNRERLSDELQSRFDWKVIANHA